MNEGFAFPKSARLTRKSDIDSVFSGGDYRSLGMLRAKFTPSAKGHSRFFVSVRKKVGHSPTRSRLRRLVREAVRLRRHSLKGDWDICFFILHPPQTPPKQAYVTQRIEGFFEDLNRLPNSEEVRPK